MCVPFGSLVPQTPSLSPFFDPFFFFEPFIQTSFNTYCLLFTLTTFAALARFFWIYLTLHHYLSFCFCFCFLGVSYCVFIFYLITPLPSLYFLLYLYSFLWCWVSLLGSYGTEPLKMGIGVLKRIFAQKQPQPQSY